MGKKKKIEISLIQESRDYVLWRRVSTEAQGKSELGLAAQLTIAQTFMGKDPVEIFTDVYSGTKLRQCKGLWQAIELCKEKNYVLVIAKSDRMRSVQEALEVLDAVGQNRLIFCDLPTSDRFVLTIMWAMWERQAIMGRINTRIALAERKRQIAENGGFFSKAGVYRTHLGNAKGADTSKARVAAYRNKANEAEEWRKTSPLFAWVEIQMLRRRPRKEIVAEAQELYEQNPDVYCSRDGKPLTLPLLCKYAKFIELPKAI